MCRKTPEYFRKNSIECPSVFKKGLATQAPQKLRLSQSFYTYKKLQGSQTIDQRNNYKFMFYTYKKLQGSQTHISLDLSTTLFYTYKKLQGSQTMITSL